MNVTVKESKGESSDKIGLTSKKKSPGNKSLIKMYAFPVLVAILMCILLNKYLSNQFFKTANKNNLVTKETDKETVGQLKEIEKKSIYKSKFTFEESVYEEEINFIENLVKNREFKKAINYLTELAKLLPNSPKCVYMSAIIFDQLSEIEKSNSKLKKAIEIYKKLLQLDQIDNNILYEAGRRLINRLKFIGDSRDALKFNEFLVNKLPSNLNLINELGVNYLIANKPTLAKKQFNRVLKHLDPDNSFALCHLAFIWKQYERKINESIDLFKKCLTSNNQVMDGKFFIHLGDALTRLNRTHEAFKFYEKAVQNGLFLSVFQRSIYNEPNLRASPWWKFEDTKYEYYLKILEDNWLSIKNEALSQFDEKSRSFIFEGGKKVIQSYRNSFDLYIRGKKIKKNCEKMPILCGLLDQIEPAIKCTRGEIKLLLILPDLPVNPRNSLTNCKIRAYMSVRTFGSTHMRVLNETRELKDGKLVLIDDSFEHEIQHKGDGYHLGLIVDFWHPDLSESKKNELDPI